MTKSAHSVLKKIMAATFIASSLLSLSAQFAGNIAYAEDKKEDEKKKEETKPATENILIAAPGFFTKAFYVDYANCETHQELAQKAKDKEKLTESKGYDEKADESFSSSEKDKGRETKAVNELMGTAADAIISPDDAKEPSKGVFGIGCKQFNFLSWMSKLIKPVNITSSPLIMGLVYKVQVLAIGVGVLLVALFGLYYAIGNETTDPIKFLIRGFFTLLLVYNLPYFAQDILNINNMLVYWISTDNLKIADGAAVASGILVGLVANTSVIIGALVDFLYLNIVPGMVFVTLTILIIFIAFLLKHIFTIMFWWYSRLIMIIFLMMLGPIYIILMILPKTAGYGKKWLDYFIGEVFTQSSMVLGMFFASQILSNLSTLNKAHDIGLIGDMMIVYGIYLLLGRIPDISRSQIGAKFGGLDWRDAQKVGHDVGEFTKKAGFVLGDMATNKASEWAANREAEKLYDYKKKGNDYNLSEEERADAQEKFQKLDKKIANRITRHNNAKELHRGFLAGKAGAALKDATELRRRALENEKAEDDEHVDNVEGENRSYAKKLVGDALDGKDEVIKDLNKQKSKEIGRYNAEKHRIANDEKRAKERDGDAFNKEEFDERRKAAELDHKKKMGELDAKMNDEKYINSQTKKLQDEARQNIERIAAEMVGNGFENEFQRKQAINAKADELQEQYIAEVLEKRETDKQEKLKQQTEAEGDINDKASQLTEAMNKGVGALSEELQKQGFSKAEADARAAQLIQKQSQMDSLKNENKKLLNTPLDKLNDKQKEKYEEVTGQLQQLESEMNALGGVVDSEQVSNALETSKNAVADMLKKEGFTNEAAQKRTQDIMQKQGNIAEINNANGHLMNAKWEDLNEDERQQRAEAEQEINALQNDISALGGALTMSQVAQMMNNGHEGLAQMLEKQGFTKEEAESRASSLINNQSQIQKLNEANNKILQENPNGLTNKQLNAIDSNNAKIASLEEKNNELRGGLPNEQFANALNNGQLNAVSTLLEEKGMNKEDALKAAPEIIQKQNEINSLKQENSNVLGSKKNLTPEELKLRDEVKGQISSLESNISSLGNGVKANEVTSAIDSGRVSAINEALMNKGFSQEDATKATSNIMKKQDQIDNLKIANQDVLKADTSKLTPEQFAQREQINSEIGQLQSEISSLSGGISGEAVSNVLNGGVTAVSAALQQQGVSYDKANSIATNMVQKQNEIDSLKSANKEILTMNGPLTKEQAEVKQEVMSSIDGLQSDISAIGNGITANQVSNLLKDGNAAVSTVLESKGFASESAKERANSIVEGYAKAEGIKAGNSHVSSGNFSNMNVAESQAASEALHTLSDIDSMVTELSSGFTADSINEASASGFKEVNQALQRQGNSPEAIQAKTSKMSALRHQVDSIRSANDDVLNRSVMELTKAELQQRQDALSEIASLESQITGQSGGLTPSSVGSTLAPHMESINNATAGFNQSIEKHANTLDSAKSHGQAAIATNILSNGGNVQSFIENSSGDNAQVFTQYLEGMGVGESAPAIVEALGGEIKAEMDYLNSPTVNGPSNKQSVVSSFVDASKVSIDTNIMSPQAAESFGQSIGEAAWDSYVQNGSDVKKFSGAASNVGSGIEMVQMAANKGMETHQVAQMFEDSGFTNSTEAAQQFVEYAPQIEEMLVETVESGNTSREAFESNFAQATAGMDSSIQKGVQATVWKELSNSHSIETRTGNAFGTGSSPTETISSINNGSMPVETLVESFSNNSVPNAPEVAEVIHSNAPEIETAMNNVFQSETPTKQQFVEAMAPVIEKMDAPISNAVVNNLWSDMSSNSSMQSSVGTRASHAMNNMGPTPVQIMQDASAGIINQEVVVGAFEEHGVPNAEGISQVLMESAPEINEILTYTMSSDSPNGNTFREDAAATLISNGMDSKVANSVAGSIWTDAASSMSMNSRFKNAMGSPTQTISAINNGSVQQEVLVETLSSNSVPNAPEVAEAIHSNASEIETVINTVYQSESPTRQEFTTAMAPVTEKMDTQVSQALVNNLWSDMSNSSSMQSSVSTRTSQAMNNMQQSPVQIIQQASSGTINEEVLIESFEEHGVPNAQGVSQVLVEAAPEINQIVTYTVNSESPSGSSFREDTASTLISGGMDSKVANSIAGNLWTDTASNISMDSRFENAWESTEKVVEHLSSPEVEVEVVVNTVAESMRQNAIPDAQETATELHQNASKIKEVIEVTVNAEQPSVETAKSQLKGILGGVKNPEAKTSLINSILKDITNKITGNNDSKPNPNSEKDKDKQ